MLSRLLHAVWILLGAFLATGVPASAQEILPFPRLPYPGVVGCTLQETPYLPVQAPRRLPADASNVLIIVGQLYPRRY